MNPGQKRDRIFLLSPYHDKLVLIVAHVAIRIQSVGSYGASRQDRVLDKAVQDIPRGGGKAFEANAADTVAILLRSDDHKRFANYSSSAVALLQSADERFVDLDPAVEPLSVGTNHGPPKFVQPCPSRFVTPQAQDALNSQCAGSVFLTCDPPDRTKPERQRLASILKNSSRRRRNLKRAASTDPQTTRAQPGLPGLAAGANKTLRPAQFHQILSTRCLRRKASLKFRERTRKVLVHALKHYGAGLLESRG